RGASRVLSHSFGSGPGRLSCRWAAAFAEVWVEPSFATGAAAAGHCRTATANATPAAPPTAELVSFLNVFPPGAEEVERFRSTRAECYTGFGDLARPTS